MLWFCLTSALADTPDPPVRPERAEVPVGRRERAVAAARSKLGEGYRWEGRGTGRLPGWDCLGILFHAYGSVDGRSWRTYEVNPSQLVSGGKLGGAVEGLDGVLRADLDASKLEAGDVLYFLLEGYEIPDEPLWVHGGDKYWPWHTGMYVGEGTVLHAKPGAEVTEQPLDEMLYDALFVTR